MIIIGNWERETQEIHNDTMQTFLPPMTAAGEFTPLHMFTPYEFVYQQPPSTNTVVRRGRLKGEGLFFPLSL